MTRVTGTTSTSLLAAVCLAGLAVIAAASTSKEDADLFADYIHVDKKSPPIAVSNPYENGYVADTAAQDSEAPWQLEMFQNLMDQRRAEKDMITSLKRGGESLNKTVEKIIHAFNDIEATRKEKGIKLIEEHFTNEANLLQTALAKLESDLQRYLAPVSSDPPAVRTLKQKVAEVVRKNAEQQLNDQLSLFKKEINQIKAEHDKQTTAVKYLFSLIHQYGTDFGQGLERSIETLETITEQWDRM